jgi:hypothetical protein
MKAFSGLAGATGSASLLATIRGPFLPVVPSPVPKSGLTQVTVGKKKGAAFRDPLSAVMDVA